MIRTEVSTEIERVVRSHLRSGEIVKVLIDEDSDSFDENVIRVRVIFHTKHKSLDVSETSQMTRRVWQKLLELGVDQFPSLSFISKSDAGKLAAA